MLKQNKRILAAALALCMTAGLIPSQAVEEQVSSEEPVSVILDADIAVDIAVPEESENEFFATIDDPAVYAESINSGTYATSGTCGAEGNESNVTWHLDTENRVLTISGTGAMMEYEPGTAPWYEWCYQNAWRTPNQFLSVVIGEGITEIYGLHYIRLGGLSLPSSLKKIGNCFSYTSNGNWGSYETFFELTLPAGLESVAYRAFYGVNNLSKVTILCPESAFETDSEYGAETFRDCKFLKEVVFPEGWTAIPAGFFSGCEKLPSVNIPSTVTTIGSSAFSNCDSLTSVELPAGVTFIGASAFYHCSELTKVNLPEGLTTIGNGSFGFCKLLVLDTFPSTLNYIAGYAFKECSKVTASPWTEAMLEGGFIGAYAFSGTKCITGHLTIPEAVTYEAYSFANCDGITSITLPPVSDYNTMNGLFSECDGLTEVTIPEGWQDIPPAIFSKCSNLTTINFPSGSFRIMYRAFSGTGLTEITVPARATLDGDVFWECKQLRTVTIEKNPNSYLGFYLPDSIFARCSSLTTVNLPDNLTEIGAYAFDSCTRLATIDLPDSLKKINGWAFQCCTSLTEITIPKGVTRLELCTFSGCTSLAKVNLPENLSFIGNRAFGNCSALKYIVIPQSVSKISYQAFADSGLAQVRFQGNSPKFDSSELGWYYDPAFPKTAILYYTAGKYGWTTPTWEGYSTYPVLGNVNFHDSSDGYYAPIDLCHFTFTGDAGPLDGVCVSYQDSSMTCAEGQTELAVGISPIAGEYVTFSRSGYHDVSLPTEVLSNFNTIRFTPSNVTTPFIQGIYATHKENGQYADLISSTFTFEGGSTTETTRFYVDINWNGNTAGKIILSPSLLPSDGRELQGGFYNAGYISANMSAGDDLYLLITSGGMAEQATKLSTVITPAKYEQDLTLSEDNGTEVSVPSDGDNGIADLLANFSFGYDFFEMLPGKVSLSPDGTVKVLLGVKSDDKDFDTYYGTLKDQLLYESGDLDKPKRTFESIRNLMSNRGGDLTVGTAKVGIEGEFQVFGYAEGKLSFDPVTGKPAYTFYEAAIGLSVEGKVSESFQAYIMQAPVYFSGSLSDALTVTIPLASNADATEPLVPPYHVAKLENDLTLRLGVGLGWDKILSAGVYGQGSGLLSGYIPFALDDSSLVLEATFGIEADFFSIFTADFPIFQGSYTVWPKEDTVSTFAARHMSQVEWKPASRDYLDMDSEPVQTFAVDETNTVLTKSMIDSSIYPGSDVQFIANSQYTYAVWTEDPGKYSRPEPNNRTKLYYSRCGSNGRWTSPSELLFTDDKTADFNPVLKNLDDKIYVLWQNANRPLTAEDTIDTVPGTIDIGCYSLSDYTEFAVGTEYYDTVADITIIGGTPYIVWASNSSNSPFGGEGTYSIHRQALISNTETEMETIATGLNSIDSLTADGGTVWFSTDTDPISDSISDYAVFCYENGTVTQVSEGGATKPVMVNGVLTWYENGSIRVGDELIELVAETDRYQYVCSSSGLRAVVYTMDDNLRQTTVYASFNDGTGWGNPIAMSGVTGNISSFSAGFDSTGTLNVLACDRGLDPDSSNYLSGTASLSLYSVTPYSDLAITNATYLSQSLVKGGYLDLVIDVANNGLASVNIMQASAYNSTTLLADAVCEQYLASGHSGQIYLSVPLEDPAALTDLKVVVSAGGYSEKTPDDNEAYVTLNLYDVSLEGSQISGSGENLTAHTMVVNRGCTDLTDITVALYAQDGETVLATQTIAELQCGTGEIISFPVTAGEETQLLTIQASIADVELAQENIVGNNKIIICVEGLAKAEASESVTASAKKSDDGTVSVAAYTPASENDVAMVCIAGYDEHGRMVDIISSGSTYFAGILEGNNIVKVKVFTLDASYNPVSGVIEYDMI